MQKIRGKSEHHACAGEANSKQKCQQTNMAHVGNAYGRADHRLRERLKELRLKIG